MHTLLLLTTVLSSLSPELDASIPSRFEAAPSLSFSGAQSGKSYLLDRKLHDNSDDGGKITRVVVEWLGGTGLGLTGLLVGSLALSDPPSFEETVVPMSLLVLGSSAGVTFAGWAMERRGRFGFALLGSFIGFAVPMLGGLGLLLAADCNPNTLTNCGALVPMAVGILVLPSLGATIGYELSEPTPWLSLGYASSAPPSEPRVFPVLTLVKQGLGVTVGIAGRL